MSPNLYKFTANLTCINDVQHIFFFLVSYGICYFSRLMQLTLWNSWSDLFLFNLFYYFLLYACVTVYWSGYAHMSAGAHRVEGHPIPLELDSQVVMNHLKWGIVLRSCKTAMYTEPLSHLPTPILKLSICSLPYCLFPLTIVCGLFWEKVLLHNHSWSETYIS